MLCGHDHDKDQLWNREETDDARPGQQRPAESADQAVDKDRGGHEHDKVERAERVGGEEQLAVGLQYPRDLTREGTQIDDL